MLNFINIAAKKPLQAFMIGFAAFQLAGLFLPQYSLFA